MDWIIIELKKYIKHRFSFLFNLQGNAVIMTMMTMMRTISSIALMMLLRKVPIKAMMSYVDVLHVSQNLKTNNPDMI